MPVAQRSNGHRGYFVHRQVKILPVMTVVSMPVILYFIGFMIRTSRVVHDHDKRSVKRSTHSSLIKLSGRIGTGRACGLTVLVAKSISKCFYRLTHCHYQHIIDGSKHFCLALYNGIGFLSCRNHTAKLQSKLAQLGRDKARYNLCIVRTVCFRHHAHGHKAILISQIGYSTKGSSIIDGAFKEILYAWIINGFSRIVNHVLKHKVCLFHLIIEEKIGL